MDKKHTSHICNSVSRQTGLCQAEPDTSSIACGNTVGFRLHSVSLAAFGATQHSNYYSLHLGYEKISITNLLRKLNKMYPFGSNSTALVLSIKTVTGCTDIVSEMNE